MLLKHNANPNAQDRDGRTPLFELVTLPAQALTIVKRLLLCGADLAIKDNKGNDVFAHAQITDENPRLNTRPVVNYLNDWAKGKVCSQKNTTDRKR